MYRTQEIISLLTKARKAALSDADEQALAEWRKADRRHEQLYQKTVKRDADHGALRDMQAIDVERALALVKLRRDSRRLNRRRFRAAAVAAAVVLVGGIAWWVLGPLNPAERPTPTAHLVEEPMIVPGTNRAILTLADGSQVILDEAADGAITEEEGIRVVKTAAGEIRYEILDMHGAAERSPELHTITTPAGGQYHVRLPDGSEVWLNASSSLTYPARFLGAERRVKLDGEGYFEVNQLVDRKSQPKPFVIELPEQTIEVLGTTFNVKSYLNEEISKTTLISGSVRVSTNSETVVLRPGQQAQINRRDLSLGVLPIDVDETISWKNGYFSFQHERINSIMNEISRWYDVEIHYDTPIRETTFEGSISKYSDLSEVLEILELTGGCTFKIEGRRVTVMQ